MTGKLSWTQIAMFFKCGIQWQHRYVYGLKIPPGAAMISGMAAHRGIEHDLSCKIASSQSAPLDEILDLVVQSVWNAREIWRPPDEKRSPDTIKKECERVATLSAKHYHANVTPKVSPRSVEQYFEVDIDGLDVPMIGYWDVVETDDTIRDTKTTQKTPDRDAARRSGQLVIYQMAAHAKGMTPKEMVLDHIIVQSKTRHQCQRHTPTSMDRYVTLRRILYARECMLRDLLHPAPEDVWWCSPAWCGYWDQCGWVRNKRFNIK